MQANVDMVKAQEDKIIAMLDAVSQEMCNYEKITNPWYISSLHQKFVIVKEMISKKFKLRERGMAGTVRIGSWNLHHPQPSQHSAFNYKELMRIFNISTIIHKCNLDIVALQEVSEESTREIMGQLNIFAENGQQWQILNSDVTSLAGRFLYRTPSIIYSQHCVEDEKFKWKPMIADFSVNNSWNIRLMNFHLKSRGDKLTNDEEVIEMAQLVCSKYSDKNKDVILLGDFNCIPNFGGLNQLGYKNVFGLQDYTNTKSCETYDNIIVPHTVFPRLVDNGIDATLKHNDPNNDHISDHRLIWAELGY